MARYDDMMREALRASDVLISGEGVGFGEAFNAPKGKNVLQPTARCIAACGPP